LKIKALVILFFSIVNLLSYQPCRAQFNILEDDESRNLVQHALDSIYNLNFHAADSIIAILENKLGEHPGNILLKAFYLSWKYKPIKKEHDSYYQYESLLNRAIELCDKRLEKEETDVEANFYLMASHAFLAELYVNNGHKLKALGEAKSAYKYVKIGFEKVDENPEFYFSSGVYNYYREKYPEENPFYKSFLWFFRSGDKTEGLNMLKEGARLASFTKAECLTYLYHIYLRYEDKPSLAFQYAKILLQKYPKNLHYVANFVENQIRLNRYDKILPLINQLLNSKDGYYQYLGETFYGNFLEHSLDQAAALYHYQRANKLGDQDSRRVPHYDSMLFLGFGRIYLKKGEEEKAREFLKRSVKSAEYSAYRKNAEELLNN
jgi:tetratricopeptide (TPR) repeat protein